MPTLTSGFDRFLRYYGRFWDCGSQRRTWAADTAALVAERQHLRMLGDDVVVPGIAGLFIEVAEGVTAQQ